MPTGSPKPKSSTVLADPYPLYCGLTVAYGLVNGLTSPALPDLAQQAALSPHGLGSLFLCRGLGSMLGAFLIGIALDLAENPHAVLAGCLLVRLLAAGLMPYGGTLVEIGLDFGLVAFCGNAIYVCSSTSISWTYGRLMGARVSLMDASFGVGGSLSPLLASALIGASHGELRAVNGYQVVIGLDVLFLLGSFVLKARPNPKFEKQITGSERSEYQAPLLQAQEASHYGDGEREEHGEALVTGAQWNKEQQQRPDHDRQHEGDPPSTLTHWPAIALCALIIFFADMSMSSVLFWFYAWSTEHLGLEEGLARLLNTAFWFCFTGVQFVWAYLQSPACGIPPKTILSGLIPFALAASCGIAAPSGLGAAGAMVALGLAGGLNALATTVLRQSSVLGGKAFAALRIASACGNMCGGSSVGFLLPSLGRLALPAVAAGSSLVNMMLLSVLLRVTRGGAVQGGS